MRWNHAFISPYLVKSCSGFELWNISNANAIPKVCTVQKDVSTFWIIQFPFKNLKRKCMVKKSFYVQKFVYNVYYNKCWKKTLRHLYSIKNKKTIVRAKSEGLYLPSAGLWILVKQSLSLNLSIPIYCHHSFVSLARLIWDNLPGGCPAADTEAGVVLGLANLQPQHLDTRQSLIGPGHERLTCQNQHGNMQALDRTVWR